MKDIKKLLMIIILLLLWGQLKTFIVPEVEAFRGATDVNIIAVGGTPVSGGNLCG